MVYEVQVEIWSLQCKDASTYIVSRTIHIRLTTFLNTLISTEVFMRTPHGTDFQLWL